MPFATPLAKHASVLVSWNANTLADSCFVCQLPLSSAAELRLLLPLPQPLPVLRHLAWLLLLLFLRARFLSVLLFIRLSVSVSLVQCFHFFFCHNIMEFILWPTGRKFVVLLRSANFAFTIARPKAKGHHVERRGEREERGVYKCKYGHNVGHTVFAAFFASFFLFFLHFLLLYFVVLVFFYIFIFFGRFGLMLQYFLMSLPGAQMGAKEDGGEEDEAHNNNMENIATSEDN